MRIRYNNQYVSVPKNFSIFIDQCVEDFVQSPETVEYHAFTLDLSQIPLINVRVLRKIIHRSKIQTWQDYVDAQYIVDVLDVQYPIKHTRNVFNHPVETFEYISNNYNNHLGIRFRILSDVVGKCDHEFRHRPCLLNDWLVELNVELTDDQINQIIHNHYQYYDRPGDYLWNPDVIDYLASFINASNRTEWIPHVMRHYFQGKIDESKFIVPPLLLPLVPPPLPPLVEFAINYNILRIMSGSARLSYAN